MFAPPDLKSELQWYLSSFFFLLFQLRKVTLAQDKMQTITFLLQILAPFLTEILAPLVISSFAFQ